MRTASIHSGARRRYGILGTAIVVGTRGRTPVRVGVFVDVCVGVEDARAVRPLERPGPTRYASCGLNQQLRHRSVKAFAPLVGALVRVLIHFGTLYSHPLQVAPPVVKRVSVDVINLPVVGVISLRKRIHNE